MSRKREHVSLDSRLRGNDGGVNAVSELVNLYRNDVVVAGKGGGVGLESDRCYHLALFHIAGLAQNLLLSQSGSSL